MNRRNTSVYGDGAQGCNCGGYVHLTKRIFPHRRGSLYCFFRIDGSERVEGDPDYRDSAYEEYLSMQSQQEFLQPEEA